MSAAGSSEEQFLCSICLEVFSEPVSTPCGHNFCKRCICQAWDTSESCFCPLCKEVFPIRPQLKKNTLLSEVVSQWKLEEERRSNLYCSTSQKAITMAIKTIPILMLIFVVCSVLDLKNHTYVPPKLPPKDGLRRVQQFAVDVTLDPNTAHPQLVLSEDLKQVHHADGWKFGRWFRDSPQRFDPCVIVLGKQSFSSGRFYFEVQVKGKTQWDLGVAQESVNRKGKISLSPKDGFWTIWLRNGEYKALAGPAVRLSPQRVPQKVGVFVDYGAGLVSFYDVDSADLLYSFTGCSFREKLFPYFGPEPNDGGKNSAPLIISAVETK